MDSRCLDRLDAAAVMNYTQISEAYHINVSYSGTSAKSPGISPVQPFM